MWLSAVWVSQPRKRQISSKIMRAIAAITIILPTVVLAIVFAHTNLGGIHAEQAAAAPEAAETPFAEEASDAPFGEE
jgi:hypothetical protein